MKKIASIAPHLVAAVLLTLFFSTCAHVRDSGFTAAESHFLQEVKPLLESNCLPCHNGRILEGRLNLSSAATAFNESPTGPLIVPGQPGRSKLLTVILAEEIHPQAMPPTGHGLNENQILILEKWIRDGAAWPEGSKGQLRPAKGAEPRSVHAPSPKTTPIS